MPKPGTLVCYRFMVVSVHCFFFLSAQAQRTDGWFAPQELQTETIYIHIANKTSLPGAFSSPTAVREWLEATRAVALLALTHKLSFSLSGYWLLESAGNANLTSRAAARPSA